MLDLNVLLAPDGIIIEPNNYSLEIEIDKHLFIQIFTEVKQLFKEHGSVARYYYIEKEDVGVYFGIDAVKIKGKPNIFQYIRVEFYSDIELVEDTHKIIVNDISNKEVATRTNNATGFIQGRVNLIKMLHETSRNFEHILKDHVKLKADDGKKVDVAKLTSRKTNNFSKNPKITDTDRKLFKHNDNEIP